MIKIISKILLVIMVCLMTTFCSPVHTAVKPTPAPAPTYDFKFYSHYLINDIFPLINEAAKPYRKFLTQEEAQVMVDTISVKIQNYLVKNKLYVFEKPKVQLFKLSNGQNVAFILRVEFKFLDKESSYKDLVNTVIINKKFLIFFGPEKTGEGI